VVSSYPTRAANPYLRLFYDHLRPHGIELVGTFLPTRRWLRARKADFDVLHFHWPEWLVRPEVDAYRFIRGFRGSWQVRQLMRKVAPWHRIGEYGAFVDEARASGKCIVWTCHNLEPHEGASWPVRQSFRALARATDLVIYHDEQTRVRCEALYAPRGCFVVMPHGNYEGVYPPARPAAEVRRRLGLPATAPLLLCVGQIRPYKGLDVACAAVAGLEGRVSLLVAGAAPVVPYARHVRSLLRELPGSVIIEKELTEQEFADVVAASDVVLLPYRTVTGSGVLLAALTLGRGVVASDVPFFADVLRGHPAAGRVFEPGDARALACSVMRFLEVPAAERETAARRLASRFDWGEIVPPVARALRSIARPHEAS
jgi:glycosyltransferase involved in cell wall biosynthesis